METHMSRFTRKQIQVDRSIVKFISINVVDNLSSIGKWNNRYGRNGNYTIPRRPRQTIRNTRRTIGCTGMAVIYSKSEFL